MAKGKQKKKKDKKRQSLKAKEYAMMTLDAFRARETRHFQRLADLKTVLNFMDDANQEQQRYDSEKRIQDKWHKYTSCHGLPKPYSPPDIKLFFVKLRHFENKNGTKIINWLLSVDERSILSQDIFRKDSTRKTLVKEIRPNIGVEYDKNVELGLKVLKDVEYFLDDVNLIDLVPERMLADIADQKLAVHHEIEQFFDRYAYRILCSEEAYMDQIDAISTEYFYEAKNFEIHIWTLKNVPILFHYAETPSLTANLHVLKIELQIPFSLLKENLTIRGIHMNFDHYSEYAKSYEQKIDIPVDQLHAGITDIYKSVLYEWTTQMMIMQQVKDELLMRRLEEEERLREEEQAKKGVATKKMGLKKPEPPVVVEELYPDIWEDFIEKDKKHNDEFLNAVFHPNALRLSEQEINLKKYMILGGTYQLYVVTKPNQTTFNSFNMTWHANNGNLYVDKDLVANIRYQPTEVNRPTFFESRSRTRPTAAPSKAKLKIQDEVMEQLSRMGGPQSHHKIAEGSKSRFKSTGEEGDKYTTNPELSPFFIITFDLPPYLCLWGEPIPCHFEADIIGLVETFEVRLPSFLTFDTTTPASTAPSEGESSAASTALTTPRDVIDELPRIPSAVLNVFKCLSTFNLRRGQVALSQELPEIEDFSISLPMTKQQIRKLQRYCVPRIVSSYRFPVEIAEEETEEARLKPKGEAGTLVRKRLSDSVDALTKNMERVFGFNNQNNPERMFPIFTKKEILFTPPKNENLLLRIAQTEPETFFELINDLDFVKKQYKLYYRGIADMPQIIQKTSMPHSKKSGSSTKIRRTTPLIGARSISMMPSKVAIDEKFDERDKFLEDKDKPHSTAIKSRASSKAGRKISSTNVQRKSKKTKEKLKKIESLEDKPITTKLEKYSHWTRAHIFHSVYDKQSCKITIWTDRLGSIGFAYKRYEHFPFVYWSIEPSTENPDTDVIVTIDTQHARCILTVTPEGYRARATEISLKYKKNLEIYLEINEPLNDLKELKKRFRDRNVNIFSEHDARFYIENGYFSEKHLATELHCYSCMAVNAFAMRFAYSNWNRLATRRDIILRFAHSKDPDEQLTLTRVTPEGATFVEVKELCTDDLNEFKLEYTSTWRNIDYYADLHHCITSFYPSAGDYRVKNANLLFYLKNLLSAIRPISYS